MAKSDQPPDDQGFEGPQWEALKAMRERADAARQERDAAIADLRQQMSDEELLAEFGIDLSEVEDGDDGRRGR